MTLTKAELSDILFEKIGLNKSEAKEFVEIFFEEIRRCLEKGEEIKPRDQVVIQKLERLFRSQLAVWLPSIPVKNLSNVLTSATD